jgi:hypothetical protein
VINVREVRLAAGAEFIVMICGDIMNHAGPAEGALGDQDRPHRRQGRRPVLEHDALAHRSPGLPRAGASRRVDRRGRRSARCSASFRVRAVRATLAGVAVFHRHTLQVALSRLAAIVCYKLAFTGFKIGPDSPASGCTCCTSG